MSHLLLVTVDSLRADHVGYHGYERDVTPNLDAYAADGSRFFEAFAHGGGTKMAFPSILTGVAPLTHGGYDRVSESQTVIAEVFNRAGYRTGGFHSNLYLNADFGYGRGFDAFYDSKSDSSATSRLRQYAKTHLSGTPLFDFVQRLYNAVESVGGVNVGSYHEPADAITDRALEWLSGVDPSEPVFCWVHYMDPHHPFLPDPEYQRTFLESPLSSKECIRLRRRVVEEPESITDADLRTLLDLYDAEIKFCDEQIGRLVERTRAELGDVTVAMTADHGEHFLEHGYFSGASMYDVKLHVPLFVEGPAWDDDRGYTELVGHNDLPPTLLDVAGLEVPESYQGTSLRYLTDGGTWKRDGVEGGQATTHEQDDYFFRETGWKLIDRPGHRRDELYDLESDPGEQSNCIDEHPDVRRRLQARVDEHKELVRRTDADVAAVDMEDHVRERLRRLGYQE